MAYLIGIISLLVLFLSQLFKYKNLLAAPVIFPFVWIVVFFVLLFDKTFFQLSFEIVILIVVGYISFILGFSNSFKHTRPYTSRQHEQKDKYACNWLGVNIVFFFSLIIGLLYFRVIQPYFSFSSFLSTLTGLQKNLSVPRILQFLSFFVKCSLWYFSYILFNLKRFRFSLINRFVFFLEYIIVVFSQFLILMTGFSRNAVLFTLLPIIFIFFVSRKTKNSRILLIVTVFSFFFISFFLWFNKFKYGYSWGIEDYSGNGFASLKVYLTGSSIGLDQMVRNGTLSLFSANGLNHIFSLPLAFIDNLFGTNLTPDVVLDYVSIGSESITNVSTVFSWVAFDLGLAFSVFYLFLLGCLYGILFKKALFRHRVSIIVYSMLSYSLVMMFFEDQFLSISQSWFLIALSFCIIHYLVSKNNFTYNSKGVNKVI